MNKIIAALVVPLVLIASLLAMDLFRAPAHSAMPCHWEDEVLVGTGDFVQGYGWTGMKCIPADDL